MTDKLGTYTDISKQLNNTETEINTAATPDEIQRANTVLKAKLVDLNKQLLAITKNIIPGDNDQEKKLDEIIKTLKDLDVNYELESSKQYTRKSQMINATHDNSVLKYWYYAFGFMNFVMIMVLIIYIIMMRN